MALIIIFIVLDFSERMQCQIFFGVSTGGIGALFAVECFYLFIFAHACVLVLQMKRYEIFDKR